MDKAFDEGNEVLEFFDTKNPKRPNESKRINLEIPTWMLTQLDLEAARLGIPRQAVIKFILDEKLRQTG